MNTDDGTNLEDRLRIMYSDVASHTPPLGPLNRRRTRHSTFRTYGVPALVAAAVAVAVLVPALSLRDDNPDRSQPTSNGPGVGTTGSSDSVVGTWLATALAGSAPKVGGTYQPLLTLRSDGTFTAYDSCVGAIGTYASDGTTGGTLAFTSSRSRLIRCEPHYAHPLDATAFQLRANGDELVLLGSDGSEDGVYTRREPAAPAG